MTVVFDTEPLLAFAFDEPGAEVVEQWLDRVYDGELNGYVSSLNLAEFRYVAIRKSSRSQADEYIESLLDMGVDTYDVDDLWKIASNLKADYGIAIGDAYAVATAVSNELDLSNGGEDVTLLVGADDDYDALEDKDGFTPRIERFRHDSA